MIIGLLLAAQAMTAVEAERAFAADAVKDGQWTAFRRWAADDAVMFDPQPVKAQALLKDLKDPAKAIDWWPTASYVSCDGALAINTGGWRRPNGGVGYFTTLWRRQPDGGWKWIVDGGDALTTPRNRPSVPKTIRADCMNKPKRLALTAGMPLRPYDNGRSPDGTLAWNWAVAPDGSRRMSATIWTGQSWNRAIDDRIAAPPPSPAVP